MIDQDTLQAISQLFKAELAAAEQRIMQSTVTLMDAEFKPKFDLLAEGQDEILRRMPSEDDIDIVDGRLDTLEAMVKKHSREIAELKKAN